MTVGKHYCTFIFSVNWYWQWSDHKSPTRVMHLVVGNNNISWNVLILLLFSSYESKICYNRNLFFISNILFELSQVYLMSISCLSIRLATKMSYTSMNRSNDIFFSFRFYFCITQSPEQNFPCIQYTK